MLAGFPDRAAISALLHHHDLKLQLLNQFLLSKLIGVLLTRSAAADSTLLQVGGLRAKNGFSLGMSGIKIRQRTIGCLRGLCLAARRSDRKRRCRQRRS
jgi:hypothetical protein